MVEKSKKSSFLLVPGECPQPFSSNLAVQITQNRSHSRKSLVAKYTRIFWLHNSQKKLEMNKKLTKKSKKSHF